ncbi:hypothetical protein QVA66_05980 [Staphylococcus chromogenes]|nr:hypothetical protein [Staphylococcus chromogenes]
MIDRAKIRPLIVTATILGMALNLTPTAVAQVLEPSAKRTTPERLQSFSPEQENLSNQISQSFETLFTEVVHEESPGIWTVNYDAADRLGISREEANSLAAFMEAPLPSEEQPAITTYDLGSYARCVVYNIAQLPLSPEDAIAIGKLLKDRQWKAAADKIVATAALNGATALLDYGISAAGGPVVWVGKLALYAGSCALSEQLG